MIKRIELTNFMSHERTVIEPAAGLTVLVGPNNCGKSALVSALQILCHNAKSNYVMRHGEKKCEITVETDDGHVVQWSRTKSGAPKYLIDGIEHDRLKQGVPAELHKILGLGKVDCDKDPVDVHFGEQKSPIFLLNDSGKAAAQFFASSSDAIRLVEMQSRHKHKTRDAKRDQTRLTDEKQLVTESIELLKPVDSIDQRLVQCEQQFSEIQRTDDEMTQTGILIKALGEVQGRLLECDARIESLQVLAPPPELATTQTIESLISKLGALEISSQKSTEIATAFSQLAGPPALAEESGLDQMIGRMEKADQQSHLAQHKAKVLESLNPIPEMADQQPLATIIKDHVKFSSAIARASEKLNDLNRQSEIVQTEIGQWVDANPVCPTCGGTTTINQMFGTKGRHQHG